MKKNISAATLIIFLFSVYFLPSISAITLGEIKPEAGEEPVIEQKNESPVKTGTDEIKIEPIPEIPVKKPEVIENTEQENVEEENTEEEINPRLACLLSVIMPGGGHFYLNNDIKGIGFCLAAGAGYTAVGYFMVKTMLAERGSVAYKNNLLLGGFIFFITLVVHFVGIIEAYSDADEVTKEKLFGENGDNPYITRIIVK